MSDQYSPLYRFPNVNGPVVVGVVTGNNASRKSSVFQYLRDDPTCRRNLDMLVRRDQDEQIVFMPEAVKTNLSREGAIEGFYDSLGSVGDRLKKSDIGFEYAALQWRLEQQHDMIVAPLERGDATGMIAIAERHPVDGALAFLKALHRARKITDRDYYQYMGRAYASFHGETGEGKLLPTVWFHAMLLLHTAPRVCAERVQNDPKRGEREKQFNDHVYLDVLGEQYGMLDHRLRKLYEELGIPAPFIEHVSGDMPLEEDPQGLARAANNFITALGVVVQRQRNERNGRRTR